MTRSPFLFGTIYLLVACQTSSNEPSLTRETIPNQSLPTRTVVVKDGRPSGGTVDFFGLLMEGSAHDPYFTSASYAYRLGKSMVKDSLKIDMSMEKTLEKYKDNQRFSKSKIDSSGYPKDLVRAVKLAHYLAVGMVPNYIQFARMYEKPKNYAEELGIWPSPELLSASSESKEHIEYTDSQGRPVNLVDAMLEQSQELDELLGAGKSKKIQPPPFPGNSKRF